MLEAVTKRFKSRAFGEQEYVEEQQKTVVEMFRGKWEKVLNNNEKNWQVRILSKLADPL